MAESLEIDSEDVVKLILQFLKESNLRDSWTALSNESHICMNTVDNIDLLVLDIQNGKWDSVMLQLNTMQLPADKLQTIYEHIIIELLEIGERELAREIIKETDPMKSMKESQPDRYSKLEHLCKRPFFNSSDAYESGTTKESKRQEIVDMILPEIATVQPARLLTLLNHALRYQSSQGMLPKTGRFDLFKGQRRTAKRDAEEKVIKRLGGRIRFSQASHPETVVFSTDGLSLITGSADGFIEVWDPETCKIRKDLEYQAKDQYMAHIGEAVLCSALSRDADILATGSQSGAIKVWKLSTGVCLRKIDHAHPHGITSLCFSKEGGQLLSCSFDCTARLHGLKSGKTLKEFRGHTSYVNCGLFTKDGTVVTGSSDGTIKLWDAKTAENLYTFRPGTVHGGFAGERTVHTVTLVTAGYSGQVIGQGEPLLFVCTKSPSAYLTNLQGRVIRTFTCGKTEGGDFLCATVSPQGTWVYCVGEDGQLYVFDMMTGQLESSIPVCESEEVSSGGGGSSGGAVGSREVIGIAHHPHRNILATIADNGELRLWRP